MKPLLTMKKCDGLMVVSVIGILYALITCGCNSDNDDKSLPQSADVDWDKMYGAVYINNEYLKEASARFDAIDGTDSLRVILSGVYPVEDIVIDVEAKLAPNGDIIFEGKQTVENKRHLEVSGTCRYTESLEDARGYATMVPVRISYTPLNYLSGKECIMPFAEGSGFRYLQYSNFRNDSCEFICKQINAELARHIESVSFSFDDTGNMLFASKVRGQDNIEQKFRYWIYENQGEPGRVVLVENAPLFYETLLDVLIPEENRTFGNLAYYPHSLFAMLLVHKDSNLDDKVVIAVADEMHYEIFPYLYNALLTDRVWTDKEKDCFKIMVKEASDLQPEYPGYNRCRWAFVGTMR